MPAMKILAIVLIVVGLLGSRVRRDHLHEAGKGARGRTDHGHEGNQARPFRLSPILGGRCARLWRGVLLIAAARQAPRRPVELGGTPAARRARRRFRSHPGRLRRSDACELDSGGRDDSSRRLSRPCRARRPARRRTSPPHRATTRPKIDKPSRKKADRVDPSQPEARAEDHEGDEIGDHVSDSRPAARASRDREEVDETGHRPRAARRRFRRRGCRTRRPSRPPRPIRS